MKKNLPILTRQKHKPAFRVISSIQKRVVFSTSLFILLSCLPFLGFGQSDGDYRSAKTGGGWAVGGTFEVYSAVTDSWVPTQATWAASTAYTVGNQRANSGNLYTVTTAGTSASSGGPTGTAASITDGTVTWTYGGPVSIPAAPTTTTNVNILDGVLQTSNGTGYVAGSLTVGQGNAFSGTAVLSGTAVTSVTINNSGKLMANPGVTFIGAGTTIATATLTFFANGTYYRCKGTGYTGTETVSIGSAWVASTAYTVGNQRSNGGNLYTCATAGTSDVSGGPTGTGSGIVDGSVVWNYAGAAATAHPIFSGDKITSIVIDNGGSGYTSFPGITISGSTYTSWTALTAYNVGEQRIYGYNVYTCTTAGTSGITAGPTGMGTGITDGTVTWNFTRSIASYGLQMGVGSVVITNGGSYIVAPQVIVGSVMQVGNSGNSKSVTIYGDVTFKSGANMVTGTGSATKNQTLNIGGNLIAETPISFTSIVPASTSSTAVNFTKAGTATISGVGPIAFNNLTVGATTTLIDNSTITIAGSTNFNSIASFNFAVPSVTGTIDRTNHTVALTVPSGTNVTALVPTITLIDLGGGSISPNSGVAQDFTNPFTYTVTAQNGTTTQAWTVTVTPAVASTDATLSALNVSAGTLSPAFASGTTDYSVILPFGTTTVPTITANVNETHAATVITQAPSVTGSGTVVVTAQDGTTTKTYTVNFSVAPAVSSDATLSALNVSTGTLSPAFDAGTTTYNVVLPFGTTAIPTITATVNEAHATTVITQASSVTGSGTIVVTAQDGTTKMAYTVTFSVAAPSTDATLSALNVSAGKLLPDFASGTFTYSVVLPSGTTIDNLPAVIYTTAANATVVKTYATTLPGTTTIHVTAQDGIATNAYTINFSVASADATLKTLAVSAGALSPVFAAETTNYNVVLPAGTSTVPTITAAVNEAHATTVITQASSVTGSGTVVVKAQDTTITKKYTITFSLGAPDAPVAHDAIEVAKTSFTANWATSTGANGYLLDIATDSAFTSFFNNYHDVKVSNVTSFSVTGLTAGTTYYYRVRATNGTASANSNTITVHLLGTGIQSIASNGLEIAVTANGVELESNNTMVSVQVVNVNGKLMTEKSVNATKATISTEGWASGIYVFTIKTQDGVITKKIGIVK